MGNVDRLHQSVCPGCRAGEAFGLPFSMAFQPIVDVEAGTVFAYEALVRGPDGMGAATVLSAVTEANRYGFDQACRVKAIELAAGLDLVTDGARLSINFLPNAVYEPTACIRLTMHTAERTRFPPQHLIFEFTENERVDTDHLSKIILAYKKMGFMTAIDDFGAGYAGLTLLARFQPDIVKLDMDLVRGIDGDRVKRSLVRAMVTACAEIGIAILAEGVETIEEYAVLRDFGVRLQQGYLFARPAFQRLAVPDWSVMARGEVTSEPTGLVRRA